jgi:hypothetical protein
MGECDHFLTASFNRSLQVEARDERLSGDGGAVLLREAMERSGVVANLADWLDDPRDPDLITYTPADLLRTRLLLMSQGWRHGQDADRLRQDPALCITATGHRGADTLDIALPSQSTVSRLDGILARPANNRRLSEALMALASRRLKASRKGRRKRRLAIDIDGLPIAVAGHQPGSAFNGHYKMRIYDPLIASVGATGDMLDALLRPGNAGSADGALAFIRDVVTRAEQQLCQVGVIRIDAGFPGEELLSGLESDGTPYIARLKPNAALDRLSAPYRRRPAGRPPEEPREWCLDLSYQAGSWAQPRRIILVVTEQTDGDHPRAFYLVTSIAEEAKSAEEILQLYRERGTAEGHMGEVKAFLAPALSSSPRPKSQYAGAPVYRAVDPPTAIDPFARNEAVLKLNLIAYQLLHVARTAMETATGTGVSLHRLQRTVLTTSARFVRSGRRLSMIIERRFADFWQTILAQLDRWSWAPPCA